MCYIIGNEEQSYSSSRGRWRWRWNEASSSDRVNDLQDIVLRECCWNISFLIEVIEQLFSYHWEVGGRDETNHDTAETSTCQRSTEAMPRQNCLSLYRSVNDQLPFGEKEENLNIIKLLKAGSKITWLAPQLSRLASCFVSIDALNQRVQIGVINPSRLFPSVAVVSNLNQAREKALVANRVNISQPFISSPKRFNRAVLSLSLCCYDISVSHFEEEEGRKQIYLVIEKESYKQISSSTFWNTK